MFGFMLISCFFIALQVVLEFKPKDAIVKVTQGDETMITTNG